MPEVNVPFPKEFPAPMSTIEEYPQDDFAQSENLPPLDIQAEVDSQAATTRVPLSEKEKKLNRLSYLMSVKQRTVAQLNSEISDLQTKLKDRGERKVHYQKKYVSLREASKNKTIENLRAKVKILQNQKKTYVSQTDKKLGKKNSDIAAFQERIAQLERDLASMSQRARREQRLKSYYKTLPSVAKVWKSRTGREISKLNNYIKVLEDRLLQTENNGQTLIDTKGEDGTFSDDVRLAVIELLGLEVAVHKVSPVIQAVAKHVFKHKFKPCDLPGRMTVLRISDEGQYLTKCLYADKLHACSHFGENKDGTRRKKVNTRRQH
ncbi:hypothetical protein SNE40_019877 [Patella caerulea]|uniref:Uncharacterized protein n=1 Tax=Patella caerulea TaxID=87958 RepID=A0AAN8G1P0_PATCE